MTTVHTAHTTHRTAFRSMPGMLMLTALLLTVALAARPAHADSGETAAAILLGAAFLYAAHEADKDRYDDHRHRERHHYRESRHYYEEHYGHGPEVCRERGHRHRGEYRHPAHGKRPAHSYHNRGKHRGHYKHRGRDDGPRWAGSGHDAYRHYDRRYRY